LTRWEGVADSQDGREIIGELEIAAGKFAAIAEALDGQ